MRSIGVLIFLAALAFGAALVLDVGGIQARLFAGDPERPPPPVAKLPAPAAPPRPAAPITPAWYLGATGYEGGELERQAARASMVVYFQRRKCDACRRFEREVLAAPEVKAFLSGVVKVRLDPDDGPAEQKLAARLGVGGVPAVAVVSQHGPPRLLPDKALSSAHQLVAFSR